MGTEFALIDQYFKRPKSRGDVLVGIGDDCAILAPPPGQQLAITVDTLVVGVHFLPTVSPENLGHKALAVNLSDLAACGAQPAWCTLALTLPMPDAVWLQSFMAGFLGLAKQHGVELVGGDTTRGPLAITVQAMGHLPSSAAILRGQAKPGDLIYVSGEIGSAGLGLRHQTVENCGATRHELEALERPIPRTEFGVSLRGVASAGIDISDGLVADLSHILDQSGVGATLDWEKVPMSPAVRQHAVAQATPLFPLTCGDDYELCFTVPERLAAQADDLMRAHALRGKAIGRIEIQPGLRIRSPWGDLSAEKGGYEHF